MIIYIYFKYHFLILIVKVISNGKEYIYFYKDLNHFYKFMNGVRYFFLMIFNKLQKLKSNATERACFII